MSMNRRQFARRLALGLGAAAVAPLAGRLVAGGGSQSAPSATGAFDQLAMNPAAALGLGGVSAALKNPSAAAAINKATRAHPLLQYGSVAEPGTKVNIIVSKTSGNVSSSGIASALPTSVIKEFSRINTFLMQVPLGKALALAKTSGVRYAIPDRQLRMTAIDDTLLKTTYDKTIAANLIWNSASVPATGQGVTIAVVDTGVNAKHPDFASSSLYAVNVNPKALGGGDGHGHGTHIAGIINGRDSQGRYIGVAPGATVISVKVADETGAAMESDLLSGLQWVYDNRAGYSGSPPIKICCIAFSSSTAISYSASALAAYVEQLWQAGIVVVCSAGNRGTASDATWYAPGNDPFVISVGALDENLSAGTGDDSLASFSSRGYTQDYTAGGAPIYKPEVVAPGRKIVSTLAGSKATVAVNFPDRIVDSNYIRLSGTSMAAPVLAGAVALLLQRFPALTPNQVKWLLMNADQAYPGMADGMGMVNPLALINRAAQGGIGSANSGLTLSSALDPISGTVTSTAYWDQAYWDQAYWDQAYWDQASNLD